MRFVLALLVASASASALALALAPASSQGWTPHSDWSGAYGPGGARESLIARCFRDAPDAPAAVHEKWLERCLERVR
jgi:hypothetical protein